MDHLTPPVLTAIREIRWHLLAGRSLKECLMKYLSQYHDEFSVKLNELWSLKVQGELPADAIVFKSHYAQALWDLIERGHKGQPILEPLMLLEDDVESAAIADLDMHVATLPFKALLPLLLFQFPAFVILLIGPLLRELAKSALYLAVAVVLIPKSYADSLNEVVVRRIHAAKRSDDVTKIQSEFAKLQVIRLACQLQLKERSVPYACYQALHLENSWSLHTNRKQLKALRERLDQRCEEATDRFQGLTGANVRQLSARCRQSVHRAQELWAYKTAQPQNWREN